MLKWTFLNMFSKFGIWALGSLPSTTPGPFKGFRMAQLFSYINTFLLFHWAASPANAAKGTVGKTVVLRLNQSPAVAPNSTKATGFTTGTHSGKKPVLCRVVLNEPVKNDWNRDPWIHIFHFVWWNGCTCNWILLCPHLICCNMLLWLKQKKLGLCTNAQLEREEYLSQPFYFRCIWKSDDCLKENMRNCCRCELN